MIIQNEWLCCWIWARVHILLAYVLINVFLKKMFIDLSVYFCYVYNSMPTTQKSLEEGVFDLWMLVGIK